MITLDSVVRALLFLGASAIAIPLLSSMFRSGLRRKYEEQAIQQLFTTMFRSGLWFLVLLITLRVMGMGEIAASLGTAAGFIALGVSYATKDVISDTVAGVYLAKDDDFSVGQKVIVSGVEGEVSEVGLRNSKLKTDDGVQVYGNSKIDQEWKRLDES